MLSFKGVKNSEVLQLPSVGGYYNRRTKGQYDESGNALWHEGDLLVEGVYRFKGQSRPVVVLCEVDFETFSPLNAHKFFVGMTRGNVRVEIVISMRAERFGKATEC